MSHPQNKPSSSPFDLDPMEFPFRDTIIVQSVPLPTMLRWGHEGSGFFVETDTKPNFAEFEPATFVRNDGKQVQGFAVKAFDVFPVAARIKWEVRESGNRVPVDGYQKGARSKTNVLGIASDGTWLLVTATGLASKELNNAFHKHRYAVARQHNAASFAVAMACITGEVELIKESYVNKFVFVASRQRCTDELGWAVRTRWEEVQAWDKRQSQPDPEPDPELQAQVDQQTAPEPPAPQPDQQPDPAPQATQPDPEPDPEAPAFPVLVYGNAMVVDMDNQREVSAYTDYHAAQSAVPASRSMLRTWTVNRNGGNGHRVPA